MAQLLPGLASLQNIHPMFVHFPIAFFWGALAMEGAAIVIHERFHTVSAWLLYLGAVSAVVTMLTGIHAMNQIAEAEGGHEGPTHELIHIHQHWMVSVTTMGVILASYLYWMNTRNVWKTHRWGYAVGLLVLVSILTLGADRGARLVYEFGYGVNPTILKERPQATGEDNHHH
ncbi:MAG TPA: DUF2231 domain-containing protein [Nitrospiria bacterium]|nr:DUF2231 domain-containing protein [Nitrospiria bacterium]